MEAAHLEDEAIARTYGRAALDDLNYGTAEVAAPVGPPAVCVIEAVFLGQGPGRPHLARFFVDSWVGRQLEYAAARWCYSVLSTM